MGQGFAEELLTVRSVVFFMAIALTLSATSCRNRVENIYPVSGKVTYNGTPAAGAAIFFNRRGADYAKEHLVMGVVHDDGSFDLVCGPLGKGAPPGEYDVAVEWKPIIGQKNGNPQRGPDRFHGRYADAKHPILHATVEARPNDLPPFELTD